MELLGQMAGPLGLVEELTGLDDLGALDGYAAQILGVARGLLPDADPLDITQAIAFVNDALTVRLIVLAESRLGPPPGEYAWLALGSQGRGEQVPSSDQDSALTYADGTADQDYFLCLAERVVDGLARAGLPLCEGSFMATQWCRPIGELRRLFASWVDAPRPEALLQAEVFLDVRSVRGELPVDVLDRTLVAGGARGPFRAQMARAAVTYRPPLTLLGRLRTDSGLLDIKRAGTAAIVLLARLYALAAGSSARTTVLRLEEAADGGTLARQSATELVEAYRFLTGLRLKAQVEQVSAGQPPGNQVRLDDLSEAERRLLRDTLRHVKAVQEEAASRFAADTVM